MAGQIGTLNENPLHAVLKAWYARPGDALEVSIDGFIVDIVRGDLLIEIQTRGFSGLKRKMRALLDNHPVRLVYPIAHEKWIVRLAADQQTTVGRRKSPKRGAFVHLFDELVSFPRLLSNPNFSLEVLLTREEELRHYDDTRAWRRRGWVVERRLLLQVVDRRRFETPQDVAGLLPADLVEPFTTLELAAAISQPRRLAQKMAYCLRETGSIEPVGKRGRATLYVRTVD